MPGKILTSFVVVLVALACGLVLTSCSVSNTGKSQPANQSTTPQSSPTPAKTGFAADLEYVKKGQYTYVWVFSRKDGKALDKNDGAYLRTNAPQVVDWVTSEAGTKVIAGTNFDLEKGNLDLLRKRFVVEDYSIK